MQMTSSWEVCCRCRLSQCIPQQMFGSGLQTWPQQFKFDVKFSHVICEPWAAKPKTPFPKIWQSDSFHCAKLILCFLGGGERKVKKQLETRQATYLQRNSQARSCNHCCCGKAESITYSECVCSLTYPACKAHAPYFIVICGLSGCAMFSTLSYKRYDFQKKRVTEQKECVLIFSTTFVCNISHFKKISTWYYFCRILIKLGFSRQIFEKYTNIQFIENTSDGSRVVWRIW